MKMLKLNIYDQLLELAKSEIKYKNIQLKEHVVKTKNIDILELRNTLVNLQNDKENQDITIKKLNELIDKTNLKSNKLNKKIIPLVMPAMFSGESR